MITNFLNKGSNFIKNTVGKSGAVTGVAQAVGNRLAAAGLPLGGIFGRTESSLPSQTATPSSITDWAVSISCPQFDTLMGDSEIISVLGNNAFKGIRFPTTPAVFMSHSASYDTRPVLHNNYPYYAYQNSQVDSMTINGSFPVMDDTDGQHWLATIHFLRTVTKMYYGAGQNQGNPPPVCKLNGYGDHVFQNVPVIITNFTVDFRQDVDYIGVTMGGQSAETEGLPRPGTGATGPGGRYSNTQGISPGQRMAMTGSPYTKQEKKGSVNYVPTDSMITVQCVPIYSRNKISNKFNLKAFASGKLAKDGFI